MRQLLGVAWFTGAEWAAAIERWPDLTDELPADHERYRGAIEGRLRAMQPHLSGATLALVAISIEDIEARAAADEIDPGSADARGRVAADGARLGRGVPWPPGRNDACWCGSGEKYKRCCATRATPPPSAAADA